MMLSKLIHWLTRNSEDRAWQPTGIRYTTDRHHDQRQGEVGLERTLKREAAARKVAAGDGRRQTVVAIDRRRA